MSKALIVGGNSGIGLASALNLLTKGYEHIYIAGKDLANIDDIPENYRDEFEKKTSSYTVDLTFEKYDIFNQFNDIDTLIITAGFGRVALFENLTECEIKNLIKCNELAAVQIISKFYDRIKSENNFYTAVMVSICGHIVSPFFSVYGAAKAGLAMFIENINTELKAAGLKNRVLDCSPGSVSGTSFAGGRNSIDKIDDFADCFVSKMLERETLYIPKYDEIFKDVIEKYRNNPEEYGAYSYEYKKNSGRISEKPQVVVGYLSGTFDLFHIGHLNLLRKAKEKCDYLIVGVHESGSWKGKVTFIPFEERKEIVGSIKYVDRVEKSFLEDSEAWNEYHYDKLFVGSDYFGSERFKKYEEFFKDKNVEIIYFPYTKGISSTQLREAVSKGKKDEEK
ncbi:MAG: SDR family NAD(P)-dependent oxidoreductase [Clostridia bacterium]|nr:SDR family NAD(P)-dependent oxidoreductase [Clostridia bacterium]